MNTFDIETLDLVPTGVVLSLGVCTFNITRQDSFEELVAQSTNILLDKSIQILSGRTVSQDTMNWWEQQGMEAQLVLNPEHASDPNTLFTELNKHYTKVGFQPDRKKTRWFSRGYFDIAFMDDFCRTFQLDPMIKFWTWRDVRSFLDGQGLGSQNQKMDQPAGMIPHNSAHDAAFDAFMMQRMYARNSATNQAA